MRAATIRDGEIVVEEHPDPEPEAGELLVRVRAAGLNGADMLQVAGHYPPPPGAPADIPGLELAGEVVAVGRDVERFEVGDRVMAVVAGGGQAELAVVHERAAMPVPDELDWTAAGGVPEVFTTAHDALFTQAGLTRRRAPAHPRRRGRRRHGRAAARHDGRRARDRDGARPGGARARRRARRPGHRAGGLRGRTARSTSILELVGAPEPAGRPARSPSAAASASSASARAPGRSSTCAR